LEKQIRDVCDRNEKDDGGECQSNEEVCDAHEAFEKIDPLY
jgi:hypothetical protein